MGECGGAMASKREKEEENVGGRDLCAWPSHFSEDTCLISKKAGGQGPQKTEPSPTLGEACPCLGPLPGAASNPRGPPAQQGRAESACACVCLCAHVTSVGPEQPQHLQSVLEDGRAAGNGLGRGCKEGHRGETAPLPVPVQPGTQAPPLHGRPHALNPGAAEQQGAPGSFLLNS